MRKLWLLIILQHLSANHMQPIEAAVAAAAAASAAAAMAAVTDSPPPLKVSASEATLLTTPPLYGYDGINHFKTFAASSSNDDFNDIPNDMEEAYVAPTVSDAGGGEARASQSNAHNKSFKNRFKIAKVFTNCSRDLFEMRVELNRPFHGLLYAKEFPHECRARGTSDPNITLRLPTSGCGVRVEPRSDGSMELSVRIMMQMEEKLRQSSDILKTVKCKLPLNAMGMSLSMVYGEDWREDKHNNRHGRMQSPHLLKTAKTSTNHQFHNGDDAGIDTNHNALNQTANGDSNTKQSTLNASFSHSSSSATSSATSSSSSSSSSSSFSSSASSSSSSAAASSSSPSSSSSASSTPRVRIWLELGGPDGSGSVVVGQATTLTVRAVVPGTMGVRIVDCAALDGLGESTQQLLDERGCPIDEQVMPALHTRTKPAEDGWSKHNEDDLVERTYTATFPAFKFPDRERLHVSCGVQLCKGRCPNVNCRTNGKLVLSTDKHLARIEVFNSLAVTAPQIEVDRLRYDRRHNMSAEEYPPYVRPLVNDGTLCLSVSKLAMSFCILGLIFLVAIVVAISSLIRSRRRSTMHHHCGTLSNNSSHLHRGEVCTSMFSSSSESAQSARFGTKFFMPYYPNTLPYGRVY